MSAVDLKSKEEKDAELDKRIEALRKKNKALVKRYQEIEEDRKKAEQEGIAVTTPRKVKYSESETDKRWKDRANLSITVDNSSSPGEKHINDRKAPNTPRNVLGTPNRTSPSRDPERTTVRVGPSPSSRSSNTERPSREGSGDGMGRRGRGRKSRGEGRAMLGHGGRDLADHEGEAAPFSERGRGSVAPGRGGRMERGPNTGAGGGDASSTLGGPDRKIKEWEEKRRQNIEKMNEEMEKIAEYERNQRDGVHEKNPFRNFLDDPRRSGPFMELDRKEGSRRHTRNWGGTDFEKVKTGMEQERAGHGRRSGPKDAVDMTLLMTGRERAEYMRWKKEREQIDQERLARHRKPTGQWRREWDAEKNEAMFKDGGEPASGPADQGGRREESRRAPKPPTFGEFLSEGRTDDPGRKKGHGRRRAQGKVYSMHDDRWEKGKEEEVVENKEAEQKMEKEERSPEPKEVPQVEEEDEDEWEDEEEEETIGGADLEEDFRDAVSQPVKVPAKEQRSPRPHGTPKLKMPLPGTKLENTTREVKPSSPFSPSEGYRPVFDWGEEMEQQSPRSSSEDSPPQGENRKDGLKGGPPKAEISVPNPPGDIAAGPGAVTVTVGDVSVNPVQDLSEVLEAVAIGSLPEARGRSSTQLDSDGSAVTGSETHQAAEQELCQLPPEEENVGNVPSLEPLPGMVHTAASETVCVCVMPL